MQRKKFSRAVFAGVHVKMQRKKFSRTVFAGVHVKMQRKKLSLAVFGLEAKNKLLFFAHTVHLPAAIPNGDRG